MACPTAPAILMLAPAASQISECSHPKAASGLVSRTPTFSRSTLLTLRQTIVSIRLMLRLVLMLSDHKHHWTSLNHPPASQNRNQHRNQRAQCLLPRIHPLMLLSLSKYSQLLLLLLHQVSLILKYSPALPTIQSSLLSNLKMVVNLKGFWSTA